MSRQHSNSPELHSVDVMRSVGGRGSIVDQRSVRCERFEGCVPLSRCIGCEHRVALRRGRQGEVEAISCRMRATVDADKTSTSSLLQLPRLTVGDLMTRNVLCVRPELSIDAVIDLFLESGLKAVPVVDERGAPLGVVCEAEALLDVMAHDEFRSSRDLHERAFGDELLPQPAQRTVASLMQPVRISLPEHTPVTQAAAVMAFEGEGRVTVVSQQGQVVGLISAADILYWLAKMDGYVLSPPTRVGCAE